MSRACFEELIFIRINEWGKANFYSFSGPLKVFTSLEAELGAILHISQIISNKIFRGKRIVVCTDSLEAMDLIFSGSYLCSEVLIKGKKIQELVNSLFCLNFVSKDNNSDADSLAKGGLGRQSISSYWAEGWGLE